MRPQDVVRLLLLCTTWGLNFVVLRFAMTEIAAPPLFFSGIRFLLLSICLLPWLAAPADRIVPLASVGVLTGGAYFALLSIGLQTASASGAAVVTLLSVPFITGLSALILGESFGRMRAAAIAVVLTGAGVVMVDPSRLAPSLGLLLIAFGSAGSALGVVLMKRLRGGTALQVQAWVGAVSGVPLLALSLLLEPDAFSPNLLTSRAFWLVQLFSVLLVSIMGHVFHYQLVKRYDVSVVAALTLLTPLSGVFFGVLLAGEELRVSFIVGAAITLAGALVLIFERRGPPR